MMTNEMLHLSSDWASYFFVSKYYYFIRIRRLFVVCWRSKRVRYHCATGQKGLVLIIHFIYIISFDPGLLKHISVCSPYTSPQLLWTSGIRCTLSKSHHDPSKSRGTRSLLHVFMRPSHNASQPARWVQRGRNFNTYWNTSIMAYDLMVFCV